MMSGKLGKSLEKNQQKTLPMLNSETKKNASFSELTKGKHYQFSVVLSIL